jgi:hypothetical protein
MFDAYTWMVVDDGETTLFSMDKWLEGEGPQGDCDGALRVNLEACSEAPHSEWHTSRVPMDCRYLGHT